jgi:HAD superfamily hydrolase (TIGR01509 family)
VRAEPQLVIFDCDGVLVDSEPIAIRVLLETLEAEGLSLDPATGYERFLGRSLSDTRGILAADFGVELTDAALERMRQRLYAAFRAGLGPTPGISEAIDGLGTAFCVASSSQPERIRLSLDVTGLLPRFGDRIFSATMVSRGKPAPDLFLHAAGEMGAEPSDCLVVEDSPAGIEAARAGGMGVVAFLGGSHARLPDYRERIAALEPDRIITDMRDLLPDERIPKFGNPGNKLN